MYERIVRHAATDALLLLVLFKSTLYAPPFDGKAANNFSIYPVKQEKNERYDNQGNPSVLSCINNGKSRNLEARRRNVIAANGCRL